MLGFGKKGKRQTALIALIPIVKLALDLYLLVVPGPPNRNQFGPANIGFLNT